MAKDQVIYFVFFCLVIVSLFGIVTVGISRKHRKDDL